MEKLQEKIKQAASFIREKGVGEIEIGLILGSGLRTDRGIVYRYSRHPMAPFISILIRLFISTAYSRGSSFETLSAKPLTIMALASSSDMPLLIR